MNVDWKNYKLSPEIMTMRCPFVDSVKISVYKKCLNKACRERANPQILNVSCSNAACRRNMFVERCKKLVI